MAIEATCVEAKILSFKSAALRADGASSRPLQPLKIVTSDQDLAVQVQIDFSRDWPKFSFHHLLKTSKVGLVEAFSKDSPDLIWLYQAISSGLLEARLRIFIDAQSRLLDLYKMGLPTEEEIDNCALELLALSLADEVEIDPSLDEKTQKDIRSLITDSLRSHRQPAPIRPTPDLTHVPFSVMIPVYNTPPLAFGRALQSIADQTLQPSEVLISFDGSPSKLASAYEEICQRFSSLPLRIFRREQNQGVDFTRNEMLKACQTSYLFNIDSDNEALPHFCEDLLKALLKNPAALAAVPHMKRHGDLAKEDSHAEFDIYRPLGDLPYLSFFRNQIGDANAGYNVEHLRALGGWHYHRRTRWVDLALFLKARRQGFRVVVVPKILLHYFFRSGSITATWPEEHALSRTLLATPALDTPHLFLLRNRLLLQEKKNAELASEIHKKEQELARMHATLQRKCVRWALKTAPYFAGFLSFIRLRSLFN